MSELEKHFNDIMEKAKSKMKGMVEDTISELYCNHLPYVELDADCNLEQEIIDRIVNGDYLPCKIEDYLIEKYKDKLMNKKMEQLERENKILQDSIEFLRR